MGTKLKTPGQAHSLLYPEQPGWFPLSYSVIFCPYCCLPTTCWVNPTILGFLAKFTPSHLELSAQEPDFFHTLGTLLASKIC